MPIYGPSGGPSAATLADLNTLLPWPGVVGQAGSVTALGGRTTLNAAGEYDAFIFCADENMTISHVGFRPQSVTGAPIATITVEPVGTDGLPTGALWAANTSGVTATLTTTWVLTALTAPATVLKGELFCVKIAYTSGTSLNTSSFTNYNNQTSSGRPYAVVNTGTPTRSNLGEIVALAIGSSATSFYCLPKIRPVSSMAANTFDNTSAAKRGMRFILPFKARAAGIRCWLGTSSADFATEFYTEAGALIESKDIKGLQMVGSSTHCNDLVGMGVVLEANTPYRAVLRPTAAVVIFQNVFLMPSADYLSAWPGGANCHYTTYVTDAWTDDNTRVPLMDILLDQLAA